MSNRPMSLPATGRLTIMEALRIEKYRENSALLTPKNELTGVKKMPAHDSTSAHGTQVSAMPQATMR